MKKQNGKPAFCEYLFFLTLWLKSCRESFWCDTATTDDIFSTLLGTTWGLIHPGCVTQTCTVVTHTHTHTHTHAHMREHKHIHTFKCNPFTHRHQPHSLKWLLLAFTKRSQSSPVFKDGVKLQFHTELGRQQRWPNCSVIRFIIRATIHPSTIPPWT